MTKAGNSSVRGYKKRRQTKPLPGSGRSQMKKQWQFRNTLRTLTCS